MINGNQVGIEKFRKSVGFRIWFGSNIQRGIHKNNKLSAELNLIWYFPYFFLIFYIIDKIRIQKSNFRNLCFFINAPVIIFWRMRVSLEIYLFHWANSINRFLLNEIWRLKVFRRIWCNVKAQQRFSSINACIRCP